MADRFVSPAGDDRNPGTSAKPWRSWEVLPGRVKAGDNVFLAKGSYGRKGAMVRFEQKAPASLPIRLVGSPAGRPTIMGMTRFYGSGFRISGLDFAGPTGPISGYRSSANPDSEGHPLELYGTDIHLMASIVRDGAYHAGIYSTAEQVKIIANVVRNNGSRRPEQANLCHGMYIAGGSGQILENWVERNVAYGIHLWKEPGSTGPHDFEIARNLCVGHGRAGIILAGQTSKANVHHNASVSNQQGFRTYDLRGKGNNVDATNWLLANSQGAQYLDRSYARDVLATA